MATDTTAIQTADPQAAFVKQCCDIAGAQVQEACRRNIPLILGDIETVAAAYPDSNGKLTMCIKLEVLHTGKRYAAFRVNGVTWNKVVKYNDDDFDAVEVNPAQPDLPFAPADGGEAASVSDEPQSFDAWAAERSFRNLADAAREMGVKIFRAGRPEDGPHGSLSVAMYDGKSWMTRTLESTADVTSVWTAAMTQGNICISGRLFESSKAALRKNEFSVITLDAQVYGENTIVDALESGPTIVCDSREDFERRVRNHLLGGGIIDMDIPARLRK